MLDILRKTLVSQAKKCQTANGGALLLSLARFIADGTTVFAGMDELWQVADHLAKPMSGTNSAQDVLLSDEFVVKFAKVIADIPLGSSLTAIPYGD